MSEKVQEEVQDGIMINGFFRVQLVEKNADGEPRIVGDTGLFKNRIPNDGNLDYLCRLIGSGVANSKQISRMMLGTGTLPATDGTVLPGELNTATYTRTTVTISTGGALGSTSVEFRATFASSSSHLTEAAGLNLSNIGIINNTTSAGTIFAGNTYTSSTWNTNQDAQCTYKLTFAGP